LKPRHRRLTFVLLGLSLLGMAAALVLSASEDALVFFLSPSDVARDDIGEERRIRIGGLVEEAACGPAAKRCNSGLPTWRTRCP
jgi:cytochrome c-type biogenesis protein CcmE